MPDQVHKRTIYEHIVVMEAHSRQLERELAEAQKQRDTLADALEKAKIAEMQLENADINLEQCRLNFVGRIKKLEQELKEALTAITQSKEANAGLMRACDKLESELAEVTKQRDEWKANHDNQVAINRTLRDRPDLGERAKLVDALTKQRDALAEALTEIRAWGHHSTKERLRCFINKALAATKGGSHE